METVKMILEEKTNQLCQSLESVLRKPTPDLAEIHDTYAALCQWACRCTLGSMTETSDETRRKQFTEAKTQLRNTFTWFYTENQPFYDWLILNRNTQPLRYQSFIRNLIRNFQRLGACQLTNPEHRSRWKSLMEEMARLEFTFQQNINELTTTVSVAEEELSGCSRAFVESLPRDPNHPHLCLVSLKAIHSQPILHQCNLEDTRKRYMTALNARCRDTNADLLVRLLTLRQEAAELAGFSSWAEYRISFQMAGKVKTVRDTVERLLDSVKKDWEVEREQLRLLKAESTGNMDCQLELWDVEFYMEQYRKRYLALDEEILKQYFPLEPVLTKLFRIYEKLLGMKITANQKAEIWHPSVKAYSVHDVETGQLMGDFYLDLFARDGKYAHQCVLPYQPAYSRFQSSDPLQSASQISRVPPAAVNVSNLPAPSAHEPIATLTPSHLRTLLHEFGHVIHCICVNNHREMPETGDASSSFLINPSQTENMEKIDDFSEANGETDPIKTWMRKEWGVTWSGLTTHKKNGVHNDTLPLLDVLSSWSWDAVPGHMGTEMEYLELSSMLGEQIGWNTEALRYLSEHVKTGEPLPEELAQTCVRARNLFSGYSYTRQLMMTLMDLDMHNKHSVLYNEFRSGNLSDASSLLSTDQLLQYYHHCHKGHLNLQLPTPDCLPFCSWYHPVMGYDASYYSYLWSDMMAVDIYLDGGMCSSFLWAIQEREEDDGKCLPPQSQPLYRTLLLQWGGMIPGTVLIETFLNGRSTRPDAWLRTVVGKADAGKT